MRLKKRKSGLAFDCCLSALEMTFDLIVEQGLAEELHKFSSRYVFLEARTPLELALFRERVRRMFKAYKVREE